jgi:hypothetical protein
LDCARFLIDIVSALGGAGHLATFESAAGGESSRERSLATLHFYAYTAGVYGARQMAALLETDASFRLVLAGPTLDHKALLDYRDQANERLALLFTELTIALTDCGLSTFGHTPFHAVLDTSTRVQQARCAAELSVALLNAAQRRDDIENGRYGFDRRGDELPDEILQPEERSHRIQAMLRMRGADASDGSWDEPTKLIDLNSLQSQLDLSEAGSMKSHRAHVTTAANDAARDSLLPRHKSANVPAVGARAEWNPDIGLSEAGGTIPGSDVARIQAAADGIPLPPRLDPSLAGPTAMPGSRLTDSPVNPTPHAAGPVRAGATPITPAAPQVPPSSDEPHPAAAPSASASARAQPAEQASLRKKPARKAPSAMAGKWLMQHWQQVILVLLVLVVIAFVLTIQQF